MSRADFDAVRVGEQITGPALSITRESIREFAEASLDFNPLHLDDQYMETTSFGGTRFGGVIMHGMTNFALITRMMTDWLMPRNGVHRRLETRWLKPVRPGDTIQPEARVTRKLETVRSRWMVFDVAVKNQHGESVATGEALAEFPDVIDAGGQVRG